MYIFIDLVIEVFSKNIMKYGTRTFMVIKSNKCIMSVEQLKIDWKELCKFM